MTLTLETINSAAGIIMSVLTSIAIVGGFLWRLGRTIRADFDRRDAEIDRVERDAKLAIAATDARAKIAEDTLGKSLTDHKLYAAEHFASVTDLATALQDVKAAIERLGDRLDRALERLVHKD